MVLAEEVEAKNFVLNIGHLWDGRELMVQPTISRMKEVALEAHAFGVDRHHNDGSGDGSYGGYGVR
jgi:hypothetical protein